MKALKKYPFFLILLAIFFCLHGFVENYELIFVESLFVTFFYTVACIFSLYILSFVLLKQNVVAALATFFISVYVLFFGAFLDAIKSISFFGWMHSYKSFIPISIFILWLLLFLVKRKENIRIKLFAFFNVLFILYCLYDVVLLSIKVRAKTNIDAISKMNLNEAKSKPNVYLLLFDEYPGYQSLESDFNFKNDLFYDSMKFNGFEFLYTSSNYNNTFFSMASLLNMQYINKPYESKGITTKDDFARLTEIKNNNVTACFKNIGYQINNLSIFDIGDAQAAQPNLYVTTNTDLITNKILYKRFFKDIGLQQLSKATKFNFFFESHFLKNEVSNKNIEQRIQFIASNKTNKPHFTYAHFLMPHFPFYYDSLGKRIETRIAISEELLYNKTYFISYLKYVNTAILKMTNQIISKDSSAIIIVLSDHGFRNNKDSFLSANQFNNICSIRFPKVIKHDFSNLKSNVNLFPFIFNQYFGQKMHILSDSSIFLKEKR